MRNMSVEYLVSLAAETKADHDYRKLFDALQGHELFFNVTHSNDIQGKSEPVSTPLVAVGDGLNAVLFFTSNNSKNLKIPYAGIVWERALEMVASIQKADGLIIQNHDASWVAINKDNINKLLHSYSKQV
jgi:hypothetical protein